MASGGYEVTVGELAEASGTYHAEGDDVRQALARFRAAAALPDSAFGNLPQSASMASQYQEFLEHVTQDLTRMSEALLTGSAKLAGNAAAYRRAEQVVLQYLRNIGQAGQGR